MIYDVSSNYFTRTYIYFREISQKQIILLKKKKKKTSVAYNSITLLPIYYFII